MAFIVHGKQSDFVPAPAGLHQAVCVDRVDLGIKETRWGKKHKVRLRWQIEERMPDTGNRFSVFKDYTCSIHPDTNLRKDLESWRGRPFTNEAVNGFDLDSVVGANCQLQIVHNKSKDGPTYANVMTVIPIGKGMKKLEPEDYVREQDRQPEDQEQSSSADGSFEASSDDVPF